MGLVARPAKPKFNPQATLIYFETERAIFCGSQSCFFNLGVEFLEALHLQLGIFNRERVENESVA